MTEPRVVHCTPGEEVDVPRSTLTMAKKAQEAGWEVAIATSRGPWLDDAGQPVRAFVLEKDTREESDGKSQRVYGDVKIVDCVTLQARRGTDRVHATWVDGKFKSGGRVYALIPMSSTAITAHLVESPRRPCRWVLTKSRGRVVELCVHHGESRDPQ